MEAVIYDIFIKNYKLCRKSMKIKIVKNVVEFRPESRQEATDMELF
jgi:hypothetical protein